MSLAPITNQTDYHKILLYGPPDSGKTTFGASGHDHPEFSQTAFINVEDGLQSVRFTTAVQTERVSGSEKLTAIVQKMQAKADEWSGVRTVVIDSMTELQRILLGEICARKHAARPRKGGVDEVQIADYGDASKALQRYVSFIRNMPYHVIMIALQRDRKEVEDGPITSKTPDLVESADRNIRAMANNVWVMQKIPETPAMPGDGDNPGVEAKPARVIMLTQASGLYKAKTRSEEFRELLPAMVTNPTLPMIHEIYTQSLELGRKKATHNAK